MYTRAGDRGFTALIGGERVSKSNLRVSCYGTLDELNAVIGVIRSQRNLDKEIDDNLGQIQRNLFALGSILANPGSKQTNRAITFDSQAEIDRLEKLIDTLDATLPELTQFILPGGTKTASLLHLARTVARRAERLLVALSESETVDELHIAYLNRVSSALFVFARHTNFHHNVREETW